MPNPNVYGNPAHFDFAGTYACRAFVSAAFLVGVYLIIRGIIGLFRKGDVPLLRRRGMFARVALGTFLASLPTARILSVTNAQFSDITITKTSEF